MFGLGETKIRERRYYPMVISEKGTEEKMSLEEDVLVWDVFEGLSPEKKEILLSSEMPQKIKLLQEKFKLADLVTGNVSLAIRKIFFGEIGRDEIEAKMSALLNANGGDTNQVKVISDFIQNEILTIKPKLKVEEISEEDVVSKPNVTVVKLPLLQALSKYEQLGNQLITEERIKLRSQGETVRPSLLYWIKYYRDELGVGHHSSMERGNFLFRSENGKRLTEEERERVNLVLRSVEENFPVDIDTEQNVIIFPPFVAQPASSASRATLMAQPPMAPSKAPESRNVFSFGKPADVPVTAVPRPGTVSFTTNHVLPAEKEASLTPRPAAPAPRPTVPAPRPVAPSAPARQSNPFHIRPVSLGEKEE